MSLIKQNLQGVRAAIASAAKASPYASSDRPIALVAVSKTKPPEAIHEAFLAGQIAFGENYVQEAVSKVEALSALRQPVVGAPRIEWHLIGSLQSNKAKLAAQHFDWVQTIDRKKIADALNAARATLPGLGPLNVCVQINVSGENSKSGAPSHDVDELIDHVVLLPSLRLRGLMTVIENSDDSLVRMAQFEQMMALYSRALARLPAAMRAQFDTLSMGMSHDFAEAIRAGATMVRVGSAIFGART